MMSKKYSGIMWQGLAYILALIVAIIVYQQVPGLSEMLRFLIADIAATLVIFGFSRISGNSSFYDPYWSVQPMVIAFFLFYLYTPGADYLSREFIVLLLVFLYGIRLTYNFLRGWEGLDHQDWRYDDLNKENPRNYWWVSFSGIHMFPTFLVFGGCLSLFSVYSSGASSISWIDILAVLVTLGAIVIEGIADNQLHRFKKAEIKEVLLTSGIWGIVRYPNYLGEILFWWGLYLFALAANPAWWWTVVGPLAIHALFLFISIPMKDKRMLKKEGFEEHMKSTNALLPKF